MKLIKLTTSHEGLPIYVNPDHIVSAAGYPIYQQDKWDVLPKLTKLTTTSGSMYSSDILIAESIGDVIEKLQGR